MSVSKLESLPNEILLEIFEKYLNGMDIINAFAVQLNQRFDALIAQCRRLSIDFIRCHKDGFHCCIGLLPRYIDKIEELALSEQNTPGQIRLFLSYYPSFTVFKQLRKLYFHVDMNTVESEVVRHALLSLSGIALDTLSINVTKPVALRGFNEIIVGIFRMKTLKNLSITSRYNDMNWESLNGVSSNIEYLTLTNVFCHYRDLRYIFQCAPGLKYLDILLYFGYDPLASSSKPPPTQMAMLHTAIITTYESHHVTVCRELEPYFRCMPSLSRLEIKISDVPKDIGVWQELLQRSSESLTYFTLIINEMYMRDTDVSKILESIQTPFWIERKNFNLVINSFTNFSDEDLFEAEILHIPWQCLPNKLVTHRWTGPRRELNGNLPVLNKTWSLYLDNSSSLQNHYLNVTYLFVNGLNKNLLELINNHVNCSRLQYLRISWVKNETDQISTLLSWTKNIICLQMTLNQLFHQHVTYNNIVFLDLSSNEHIFDENTISNIATKFPNLKHLSIFAKDLQNVPKLEIYLPRLCSLTLRIDEAILRRRVSNNAKEKLIDRTLRETVRFSFRREDEYITVWIDRAALQDPFWQRNDIISDPS